MDWHRVIDSIVDWIQERVEEAGAKGLVVGVSGGIDSAVVAAICKKAFPENTMGIIMPCYSNKEDQEDAKFLLETYEIPYKIVVLDSVLDTMLDSLEHKGSREEFAVVNMKPRLRMTTLYYYAQKNNYLVAGTGNKSEILTGYFTKYGDGGVDIEPIGHLFKTQVYQVAKVLEIPERIIKRTPTAGLWQGQSDETEMGVSYEELDHYLATGEGEERVKRVVDKLIRKSRHKRKLPPIPSF